MRKQTVSLGAALLLCCVWTAVWGATDEANQQVIVEGAERAAGMVRKPGQAVPLLHALERIVPADYSVNMPNAGAWATAPVTWHAGSFVDALGEVMATNPALQARVNTDLHLVTVTALALPSMAPMTPPITPVLPAVVPAPLPAATVLPSTSRSAPIPAAANLVDKLVSVPVSSPIISPPAQRTVSAAAPAVTPAVRPAATMRQLPAAQPAVSDPDAGRMPPLLQSPLLTSALVSQSDAEVAHASWASAGSAPTDEAPMSRSSAPVHASSIATSIPTTLAQASGDASMQTAPTALPVVHMQSSDAPLPVAKPLAVSVSTSAAGMAPTPHASQVMWADDLGPAPQSVWVLRPEDGSIRNALARWAKEAGWQFVWDVPTDFSIDASATLHGTLQTALNQVVNALATSQVPIQVVMYNGNRVLRVIAKGAV